MSSHTSPLHLPGRIYLFSDTFGGNGDPLTSPDPDAIISTDFGSFLLRWQLREFDIHGNEHVTDHILRLILQLHDDLMLRPDLSDAQRSQAQDVGTGIGINYAPRVNGNNAEPFWLATARDGRVRIVATPLSALAPIRSELDDTLAYLPNPQKDEPHNGLYDAREQFRSRLAFSLLDPSHQLRLEKASITDIPAYDKSWHVAYIDRFGNIVTWSGDVDRQWSVVEQAASITDSTRRQVAVCIGNTVKQLELAQSLGCASPGSPLIYCSNGNIDIVCKWKGGETPADRLDRSAYSAFGKPAIGTPISLQQ